VSDRDRHLAAACHVARRAQEPRARGRDLQVADAAGGEGHNPVGGGAGGGTLPRSGLRGEQRERGGRAGGGVGGGDR
jgi:hypothetical protein